MSGPIWSEESAEQREGSPGAGGDAPEPTKELVTELTSRLRCASCRYDLRGLSVMGTCPECGLPIQATLLSIVDPFAEELRPIGHPRLIAAGLLAWTFGAIAALTLGWVVWTSGVFTGMLSPGGQHVAVRAGAIMLVVSWVGSVVIIRPHAGIPLRRRIAAAVGVMLYPIAIKLYLDLGLVAASGPGQSLLAAWTGGAQTSPWPPERLAMWAVLAAGTWLLRGNLRVLAARSLVLRSERVDRQTIAAVVASLLIAAAGDLLGLCAPLIGDVAGGALVLGAEVLVGLGAVLLTLGMVGIMVDTWRIIPAVLHRPLAMRDLVGEPGRAGGGAVTESQRARFDSILEALLERLPDGLLALLDEVPLIVLDEPTEEMLRDLGVPPEQWTTEAHMLCGLHSGWMITERSVEASGDLPEQVHLFRRGIARAAGGWRDEGALREEIRVTLLHELGHHFGLDEDDLDRLGYA